MDKDYESLVGTNIDELIRLRISRLKSVEIARKLIQDKYTKNGMPINDNLVYQKAKGLSSTIESALNYLSISEKGLNAKILSRYYAFLQLTIAEIVASIKNNCDLVEAQKYTEQGHGLSTLNKYTGNNFLDNYYCYFRNDGHFYHYMKQVGFVGNENFFISKRIRNNDNIDGLCVVSLIDLFRRIPELQNVIEEYVGKCSLAIHFGLDSAGEHEKDEKRRENHLKETDECQLTIPPETNDEILTHVSIYPNSKNMTVSYLEGLTTPFNNFKIKRDNIFDNEHIVCDFLHKNEGLWWNSIKHYSSDYCATSYIVPVFNQIDDPIIINYILMYTLSIIVRYLPDVWYEITLGSLDNIGNLIDYYISIFDHIVPLLMLERITEKRIHLSMPGSLFAPV